MDVNDALRQDLRQFLWKAVSATWLNDSGEVTFTNLAMPKAKQYKYTSGAFTYYDCYTGFYQFAGQETVLRLGNVLWVRNYAGGVDPARELSDRKVKEVYDFLKRARRECWPELFATSLDGHAEIYNYQDRESGTLYAYQCHAYSPYEWPLIDFFVGLETIYCGSGHQDYFLHFSGGIVVDKVSVEQERR